jgi:hypothetical protein
VYVLRTSGQPSATSQEGGPGTTDQVALPPLAPSATGSAGTAERCMEGGAAAVAAAAAAAAAAGAGAAAAAAAGERGGGTISSSSSSTFCAVCRLECGSQRRLLQHVQGKKHRARAAGEIVPDRARKRRAAGAAEPQPLSGQQADRLVPRVCLPACLPRPDAGPLSHLQRPLGARLCRQGDGVQASWNAGALVALREGYLSGGAGPAGSLHRALTVRRLPLAVACASGVGWVTQATRLALLFLAWSSVCTAPARE